MNCIIVLNDGESWSGLDGVAFCIITDKDHEKLCSGLKPKEINPISEFALSDVTLPNENHENEPTLFD